MICSYSPNSNRKRLLNRLEQAGVTCTENTPEWDIIIPSWGADMGDSLRSLEDPAGKIVLGLPGNFAFVGRKTIWQHATNLFGREGAARLMPETFILDHQPDLDYLQAHYPDEKFILKDKRQRRLGLKIVEGAEAVLRDKDEFLVAQRFLTDLHRIRDYTYNLRCYLFIQIREGKTIAHLYHNAVIIYSLGKQAPDYFGEVITHCENPVPEGLPYYLSHLCEEEKLDYAALITGIGSKIRSVLLAGLHQMGKEENLREATCGQFFGFDVILDQEMQPYICEVNKGPDMTAKNEYEEVLKNHMIDNCLSLIGIRPEPAEGFLPLFEIEAEAPVRV